MELGTELGGNFVVKAVGPMFTSTGYYSWTKIACAPFRREIGLRNIGPDCGWFLIAKFWFIGAIVDYESVVVLHKFLHTTGKRIFNEVN